MRAIAGSLLMLALCACAPSLDELRSEPIRFTTTQPVPYDVMANCILARTTEERAGTMQMDARHQVAYVVVPATAEYTVRAVGGGSTVDWRRRKLIGDIGGLEEAAKAIVSRCSQV